MTAMVEQLVVGIDGSPASAAAAEWAGREASMRGAAVRMLNVWRAPTSNVQFSPGPEGLRMWEETRAFDAARQVEQDHPEVVATAEQVPGAPVQALVEAAGGSAMLVLGSRGAGALAGYVYGSVGLQVVARCDRPVVLVRQPDAGPGEEGAEVVLCVDLGRPCDALMTFAFEEAAARGAVLRVLHVWDLHRKYGYAVPAFSPQLKHQLHREKAEELSSLLEPYRAGFDGVRVVEDLAEGSVTDGLVTTASAAGLLVVGRRRRRTPLGVRIGAVTHAVVHHAPCPVAVIAHD
ncbi:universal stress protein [Streptomyces sp. NPDC020983]|uniref:universal stress protein n=1 Tax=Streptomyces sp. NPDC020983 TaxID=3365106 RepID=UPI00379BE1F6